MSTIKIKVKHLLLIIVLIPVLLFVLPFGYLFIADTISEKNPTAAVWMYKKYITAPPIVVQRDKALFLLAWKSFYIKGGSYYEKLSTDGSSVNSSYISKEMLDTAVILYKDLLKEYKNSAYYTKAYNNLLYIYTYSANTKEGEKLIQEGEASDKKAIRLIAAKYNLYYKLAKRQYSQVLNLGNGLVKEFGTDPDISRLMAEASLFEKDYDNAISYYRKASSFMIQKYDDNVYYLFQDSTNDVDISTVMELEKSGNQNTLISGRVSVLGKGIPFARVYLKDIGDTSMYSGEERGRIFGITDFNGNYIIKGAPIGSYRLLLVIPGFLLNQSVVSETGASSIMVEKACTLAYDFNFVKPLRLNVGHRIIPNKGHVRLSWEPVSGATYYMIHAIQFNNPMKPDGNSAWVTISEKIASESYNLDLAAVNLKMTGFSVSGDGVPSPQAYLGTFYPGCSVPIFVDAYDKNGLRLTSSMPKVVLYDKLPVIILSDKTYKEGNVLNKGTSSSTSEGLAKAQRLILERKPELAEKILSQELKNNPNDIEVMNLLSNIYRLGTKIVSKPNEPGKSSDSGREVIGQNLHRSIELNNRLYDLTQNAEYIRRNYFIYAYDLKDYKGLVDNYKKIPEAKLTGLDFGDLGEAELKLGKFKEAERDFDKMYKAFPHCQATSLSPILLYLYNKNFKAALAAIDQTNFRLYNVSVVQLKNNILEIQNVNTSSVEYQSFRSILKRLMQNSSGNTKPNEYRDLIEKIKDERLISIVKQAMSYYNIY